MNNIMIDIETLGKKRGCPVLSIAAVQFDLNTGSVGETFYERMNFNDAIIYGEPEASTMRWWGEQSAEARNEAFKGGRDHVSVAIELREFLQRTGNGRCIPWGNGSVFDITILEGWFDSVNPQVDAKGNDLYPWKFWDIADLRTLVRLSGIDVRAIPFAGEKHNALADACHQVKIAHAAYTALHSSTLARHSCHWSDTVKQIAKANSWIVVTHGSVGLVVTLAEYIKTAQEVVLEVCPVTHKVYVGAGLYPWIEGWDIPSRASQACYETGAGKAVNALVEVDKVLQEQGWPALCWAYLDVVPGVMICRSTNQNITSHMLRWLPVKVEGM